MQVTYAGTIIAKEPPVFGGSDRVTGFMPTGGDAQVQEVAYTRADWMGLLDRGNKACTITGTISFAACEDLDTAIRAAAQFFKGLPTSGDLVIQENETAGTKWSNAKLKSAPVVYRTGVSYAVTLTFRAINPQDVTF